VGFVLSPTLQEKGCKTGHHCTFDAFFHFLFNKIYLPCSLFAEKCLLYEHGHQVAAGNVLHHKVQVILVLKYNKDSCDIIRVSYVFYSEIWDWLNKFLKTRVQNNLMIHVVNWK